jgi:hypothetical protein
VPSMSLSPTKAFVDDDCAEAIDAPPTSRR